MPLENPPDLTGRVAIVTGSSRGIGKAVALALADAGCDICVAAKTVEEKASRPGTIHKTADAVRALGRRALAIQTDVRDEEQLVGMVEQTVGQLGKVDILVNNAGALWWRDVLDTPVRRFDLVMDVNVRAAFVATQLVLPHMAEQGWGHIVNMSPPLEMAMLPGKVAYCISKFGMTMLAHGLAEELRDDNIAVNALWPATLIESQASRHFQLGGPEHWRTADIVADATVEIVGREPAERSGEALIDEDVLRDAGVRDFGPYLCVEDGEPVRIIGEGAVTRAFGHGAGASEKGESDVLDP